METTADILHELKTLSPVIAVMGKVNVFTVPEGYFDSISETVLACLPENNNINNKDRTDLPEGYFDHLANSILDKIKAMESAEDEIKNLSSILHAVKNKNVFEVPAEYFESFASNVVDKVITVTPKEELKEVSPLLHGIQNKDVFVVPEGYFIHLADNILKKVQPTTAKLASMPRRSLIIKYSVAAMMAGVMALGLYKYIDKPSVIIPDEKNTVTTLEVSIEKGKSMNDQQFNEALENLTDTDIAKYLEKNGDITDVASLGNNIEENNLPSQEEYLLNETTLENYLKEIDKKTVNN
jgi:hypothetical protein